jgi:hypothetical protein
MIDLYTDICVVPVEVLFESVCACCHEYDSAAHTHTAVLTVA